MAIAAIERGVRVLRAVAAGYGTVSELSEHTGLALSTTARVLETLEQSGALARRDKVYRIGPTVFELISSEATTYDLLGLAKPHLHALAASTGETAGLAQCESNDIVHLGQVETEHDVSVRDWTGFRVGLHSGSIGLVILAHWPEEEITHFLAEPLERYAEQSVTEPIAIRERLEIVRRCGWLVTTDEYDQGVTTIAAPIRNRDGRGVASLHAHGPSYRFPGDVDVIDIGHQLTERARMISVVLGFNGGNR
ncbi:MAG: IclR family transcriptional regulator [Acidimicrobiales bacterium]|nr:IclR family transcriptional regulator [Acidimicrobiales bacterium]